MPALPQHNNGNDDARAFVQYFETIFLQYFSNGQISIYFFPGAGQKALLCGREIEREETGERETPKKREGSQQDGSIPREVEKNLRKPREVNETQYNSITLL